MLVPGPFLQRLYPFQGKEVGRLFGPWTTIQENGLSLLCDVISVLHSCTKQAQAERDSFLVHRIPDPCVVFGCNDKSDYENGRALHRMPGVSEKEKSGSILQSLTVYACFVNEWNPEITSQCKLDTFSFIVVHWPKRRPTSLPWKGYNICRKGPGASTFSPCIVNRTVEKVYLCKKKYLGLVAL